MLLIAIDAAVLMILLKTYSNEDLEFLTAAVIAFVASLGTSFLAGFFFALMGIGGILLATILAAAILGVAISALFGAEIKRSFLVAGIFLLSHIGLSIFFHMVLY